MNIYLPVTKAEGLEGLNKAFSDSARAAALEARRAKAKAAQSATQNRDTAGGGSSARPTLPAVTTSAPTGNADLDSINVLVSQEDKTRVSSPAEMKGRMTPPQVTHRMDRNINPYGERPIDYGHVNDLLKEKYGNERGEAAYQKMVDKPRGGVFFVAGQKIINEKGAMMQALRKSGRTDEHDYQGLYKEWKALPAAVQSKVNAYHSPYKGMSASSMARATETHRSKTTGFHKYGLGSLKG